MTDTFTYSVDGQVTARTGTTPVSVGWNGEYTDPATGMVWLRARWYDPASARFITADPWQGNPATPVSLNRYLYANADPINNTDPTGLTTTITEVNVAQLVFDTLVGIGAGAVFGLQILNQIRDDHDPYPTLVPQRPSDPSDPDVALRPNRWAEEGWYPATEPFRGNGGKREHWCPDPANYAEPAGFKGHFPGDGGGVIDPEDVLFTQDSIRQTFGDGRSIYDLVDEIQDLGETPPELPEIRVFEYCGALWTLDNRRLWAAKQAGVPIPFRWATASEIEGDILNKGTTVTSGQSIEVRGS